MTRGLQEIVGGATRDPGGSLGEGCYGGGWVGGWGGAWGGFGRGLGWFGGGVGWDWGGGASLRCGRVVNVTHNSLPTC